jgi:phospholipase/carboxylesterase
MGFSQGAALAFMIGLTYPQLAQSIVGFAGYLPHGALSLCKKQPLLNTPVFIAHGTYDKTIPIARAHKTVEWLTIAGAQVTYCESSTGHQVSLDCLKQAETFLKRTSNILIRSRICPNLFIFKQHCFVPPFQITIFIG